MRLGIIGLPLSGKTTIFNVLTRGDQPIVTSGGRIEVHTAVVNVPDPRLEQIAALSDPEKIIHAKVTYADIFNSLAPQSFIKKVINQGGNISSCDII